MAEIWTDEKIGELATGVSDLRASTAELSEASRRQLELSAQNSAGIAEMRQEAERRDAELRARAERQIVVNAQVSADIVDLKGTMQIYSESLRFLLEEGQREREQSQQRFEAIFAEIREIREDTRSMQADVRVMQTEIRGLQTENRRILERLERRDQQ